MNDAFNTTKATDLKHQFFKDRYPRKKKTITFYYKLEYCTEYDFEFMLSKHSRKVTYIK